ncbi:putative acetyltransferase [Pseudomonas chlororaphis subsp. piscium]|uniref:GNAT family N-acetyltransferase n=1 Tax=Pseudomonas chlororaphis TaxID=587753 RepID=UPI000F58E580|nr:GNAT family N-acetyltransferase [Pseudomonas chlororaphis]AZC50723.1 putative acetyltransferase [Pseudomonas chlororaphis subsp. piscium]
MTLQIRLAIEADAILLPAIERSAAALFRRDPELAWLADAEVPDAMHHLAHIRQQRVWVAVLDQQVCAFLDAEACADALHIWEISVASSAQGCGIGRRLLERVCEQARQRGFSALTLSTFRQLPWNEPFYQRCGFVTLDAEQLGPRLQQVLAEEARHGLPATRRCAMRLTLPAEPSQS